MIFDKKAECASDHSYSFINNFLTDNVLKLINIRAKYQSEVASLREDYEQYKASSAPFTQEYAKHMYELRNEAKEDARLKTWESGLEGKIAYTVIYGREAFYNIFKAQKQFEDLAKHKSFEQIAESASRTGGEDLGLKNPYIKCLIEASSSEESLIEMPYIDFNATAV